MGNFGNSFFVIASQLIIAYMYIQCVFFIELKVFVSLTYLYLSEIKKQGLIFSVGMGHLKICQKKLDLDRGFLSKPVFLLYACRASV